MKFSALVVSTAVALVACGPDADPNKPPTIDHRQVTTAEDTELSILLEASDPEGATLSYTFTTPAHGAVSGTGPAIVYTPAQDYYGNDSFIVTVSDGEDETSAMISVVVTPVNDAPIANDDAVVTFEDMPAVIEAATLTENDVDVEGDTLEITAVGSASVGTVVLSGSTVTFTPPNNFVGEATFEYTVSDGEFSDTAVVTVTVDDVNDPPVAVNDTLSTPEDSVLTIAAATLLANDTDPENQALTLLSVANPTNGTVLLNGTTITFTPTANFAGTAGFDYTVSDGAATDVGHVTVTVTPVNDAPVATPRTVTTNEETAVSIVLAGTDIDSAMLTFAISTPPTKGTLGAITRTSATSATVLYTPATNQVGADTFQFTVSDGSLTSAPATIGITITNVNDAPVAVAAMATTQEDQAVDVVLTGTDVDGDMLDFAISTPPTLGTLGTFTRLTPTSVSVRYTPTADANGGDTFRFTVTDGTLTSAPALVMLVITPVNDAPVAVDDTDSTPRDTAVTRPFAFYTANDTDIDSTTLTVTSVGNATNGSVAIVGSTVVFTPTTSFVGTAGFDYTVSDGSLSDVGHVVVTVLASNTAPTATNAEVTMDENTSLVITLAGTDPEVPPQTLTFTTGAVVNGTVGAVTSASATSATVTFTPTADFVGDATIGFTVSDGSATGTGTVVVHVQNVPVCGDGLIEGSETCDDHGVAPGDGCSASCAVEVGWTCVGTPSACEPICGDGVHIADHEECDDGNAVETDGCTTQCKAGPVCAASVTELAAGDRFATDTATGHCYVSFDDEVTTFAAAQSACVAAGGYLATITSATEQALVASVHNTAQVPWIGLSDAATEGTFVWGTNEALVYTSWAPGKPAAAAADDDCVGLVSPTSLWTDMACSGATGRICELSATACGDGVVQSVRGEQCDDGNTTAGDGCSATCQTEAPAFFFSEYVEGSGNNKALEIYNSSSVSRSLVGCEVRLYSNGSSTVSAAFPLTGDLAGGDVLVLCHAQSNATLKARCDVQVPANGATAALGFNGDDAVSLACNGSALDVFGQIGFDPGSSWGSGNTATADKTLRRKCSVTQGDTNGSNAFVPATEWGGFSEDTFSDLGTYTCVP